MRPRQEKVPKEFRKEEKEKEGPLFIKPRGLPE